jgi:cytidylate kinase
MAAVIPVITVDGPSGSGKGTIARRLARLFGWHLLDSGALYRAIALAALEHEISLDDPEALAALVATLPLRFEDAEDETHTYLGERCIDAQLRTEATGEAASQVAQYPQVRAALLRTQREIARAPGLVADGRDMGTVVFRDAQFKFFLTASAEERARRRHKQLKQKGISVSLPALAREIAERDRRDSERSVAPLKPAEDAYCIDSTQLSADEVLDIILARLAKSGLAAPAGN